MTSKILTQEKVRSYLSYNKDTGIFTWKIRRGGSAVAGSAAGSINNAGYRCISIDNYPYLAHRIAWLYVYGNMPDEIDHIDHDRSNNRISNLRDVSHSINGKNQSFCKNNTSGITGVYFDKADSIWYSKIQVDGVQKYLGRYKDKAGAVAARAEAEKEYGFHCNHGVMP